MSHVDPKTATPPNSNQTDAPMMPHGKATVAAPKLSGDENVELKDMLPSGPAYNPEEDIMQLARLGDIQGIEKLYQRGTFDASYSDAEGITPLHWAAINNQYAMCQFLLKAGVDVNQKGGESVATAAMWAVQRCHFYTVHLLLEHGADPLLTDVQGYNILHLATFEENNILLLVLLLCQNIPVDVPDGHGHTSLMWAAYKGNPLYVDLFLRWGSDVHAEDETKFTALHWALVKGHPACIQKLIEYGSDRFAETATDFENISKESSSECNILAAELCSIVNSDAFTLILVTWSALQLTWVTMLLFVQLLQISRAVTTWENMRGVEHPRGGKASQAITSALTTGTTSMAGAQIGSTGLGPDPLMPPTHAPGGHHHHGGCFDRWKKILGLDAFVETAFHGYEGRKNHPRNPFSRGCIGNCKDFWCDPQPMLGKRDNGKAMLGGEVVNYTTLYEAPPRHTTRARSGDPAGTYESVPANDSKIWNDIKGEQPPTTFT
ncbi:hypothetical protein B7494_g777 [Chlorociboria aeruginascens]|nr:hypothetical protein B7494_g777 [Chlorociboria aeruginascens]